VRDQLTVVSEILSRTFQERDDGGSDHAEGEPGMHLRQFGSEFGPPCQGVNSPPLGNGSVNATILLTPQNLVTTLPGQGEASEGRASLLPARNR